MGEKLGEKLGFVLGDRMDFDRIQNICREMNGRPADNFCVFKERFREVTISMWNPLTRNNPENWFTKEDMQNALKIADMQPRDNLHFYSKSQDSLSRTSYNVQAYTGTFYPKPDGEYFGNMFSVTKEGDYRTKSLVMTYAT